VRLDAVRVLGVPVDPVTEQEALDFIALAIESRGVTHLVTVNAEFVMQARRDPSFLRVLESADLRTPDGAGVVRAMRRHGSTISGRVGGSDLIWSISEQAARLGHRLFLLGGAPGVADAAGVRLRETYPGLQVVGTYPGSPRPEAAAEQITLIRESRPDILMVAFGSPRQDLWIAEHKESLRVPVSMGVGGSYDYVVGDAVRAPRWMQKLELEWMWRLMREPWRWRRMTVLPAFAWQAIVRGE